LLSGRSVGFFVHMTLASFFIFKQYKLDVLILEVGLGGRIDPVNLVDPSIALIPSISLDHTDRLGDNIESIAYEKAGIMRPGIDVIYGGDVLPRAIVDQAKKIKSKLHCINTEFSLTSVLDEVPNIKFYKNNIACVLYALKLLQDKLPISLSLMHEGLTKAVLPGRFDVVKVGDITVIFDVAHNASSAKVLADNMQQHIEYASCYAVFSALASKSVLDIVSPLDSMVDDWFVAPLGYFGGESISVIQQTLVSQEVSFSVYDDMAAAFMGAYNKALTDSCACIVVYGSFYVVSEVLRVVRLMLHGDDIVS
jgi:dihydrofolate synthase / folylpolyglutamate synthase